MIKLTEDILLVLAMITDTFLASLSYGSGKIKIPFISALIISLISSAVLTLSLCLSQWTGMFINESFCRIFGTILLGAVGIIQFCQNGLKSILKKHSGNGKLSFRFFNIGFVISVYLDETKADADSSKILSAKESFALAAALSVDSISGGLGAGLSGANVFRVCIMSFAFGLLSVAIGSRLGTGISHKSIDLSWLSGVFLIVLAIVKIF